MEAVHFDVLLIEDDDDHAFLIERHLRGTARVERERTLARGLERLENGTFDALLLDLGLPDSPIGRTLREVGALADRPALIVLTSLADLDTGIVAVREGADDYLVKTEVSRQVLQRSLRYAIERRRIVEELARKNARLERVNDDLRNFAHIVAHELKQPLNPMRINCELIRRGLANGSTADLTEIVADLDSSVGDMANLVTQMLEFASVERNSGPREPVDLTLVARAAADELGGRVAEEGATITIESLPTVAGHPLQLRQVFSNLLSNALKYRRAVAPVIRIQAIFSERHVVIEVSDNGRGIPQSELESVFDMFHRGAQQHVDRGNGIGLSYCRRIVEHHSGTVTAHSQDGRGTTIRLQFPRL
ncbi:MAG: hybrid sensor histidine kinase/response regulator [Planctomycetota bacterium]